MLSSIKYLFAIVVILVSIVTLFIYMTENLHIRPKRQSPNSGATYKLSTKQVNQSQVSFADIIRSNKTFNITGQDLLVLVHIQKTGGTTFERHLVHDLKIDKPCSCNEEKRRCFCLRPNIDKRSMKSVVDATWLVSRFSTGWICGLHADWTQLTNCLRGIQQIYFITFLRHPLNRFISEFRHVQRGATWKASKSHCDRYNTQLCYGNQSTWNTVTLDEFLDCPSNMAINRQTRMLADYRTFGCTGNDSNLDDRNILSSAMDNLKEMSFFGLCEEQRASQDIFERTFRLKFSTNFYQSEDTKTKNMIESLSADVKNRILKLNYLDMELYNYAIQLFKNRCKLLQGNCDQILLGNTHRQMDY